jgi:hypothetical protein
MFTRRLGYLLGVAALCGLVYVGVKMIPDLQRYMRIRNM